MKSRKKSILILAGILIIVGICVLFFRANTYNADAYAIETVNNPTTGITVTRLDASSLFHNNALAFIPEKETAAGLVFYPGAMVDYEAYAPLMEACAREGILCILVNMPLNLAILDQNAADKYTTLVPNIDNWYIAGHSLGGAIASYHVYNNPEKYKGLIFLAAFSTKDLKDTGLNVLSIYGSEDKVLRQSSYQKSLSNLSDYTEYIIDGGNHAYYAYYGEQKGDGTATITHEEQITLTAQYILSFIE